MRCEGVAPRLARSRGSLPVWSITALDGPAHSMIAAWKDGGRRDLDRMFAASLGRAALSLGELLPSPLLVVPAPSRPASVRNRGVDLPLTLARKVARVLTEAAVPAFAFPLLSIGKGDSRRANVQNRWQGAGQEVRLEGSPPRGVPMLLVDDVVTTGATLAACAAALDSSTTPVVGALVLASAHAPGATLVTSASTSRRTALW